MTCVDNISVVNPVLCKLARSGFLDFEDRAKLMQLIDKPRRIDKHKHLIRQGERATAVHLVLEGWAIRYRVLSSGRRQIVSLMLPGDSSDVNVDFLDQTDHGIVTVSQCEIAEISSVTVANLNESHPGIAKAFLWAGLIERSVLHAWLTNLGQRPAAERVAHLLCETLVRLQSVGRAGMERFRLTLTQVDLADILGVSPVHVNRSLQDLRSAGLIATSGQNIHFPDFRRCAGFCGFDPQYLHLKQQ